MAKGRYYLLLTCNLSCRWKLPIHDAGAVSKRHDVSILPRTRNHGSIASRPLATSWTSDGRVSCICLQIFSFQTIAILTYHKSRNESLKSPFLLRPPWEKQKTRERKVSNDVLWALRIQERKSWPISSTFHSRSSQLSRDDSAQSISKLSKSLKNTFTHHASH